MHDVLKKLKGGDLRSIGRSEEVVNDILRNPSLFRIVFNGMTSDDPIVRMRSADALEKVASKHPEYLQPFKTRLIHEISEINQQEVQWHVAQMFSYLETDTIERQKIVDILTSYLNTSKSKIVKVFSLQTLADIVIQDRTFKPRIVRLLTDIVKNGSPAVKNRGKKLLLELQKG